MTCGEHVKSSISKPSAMRCLVKRTESDSWIFFHLAINFSLIFWYTFPIISLVARSWRRGGGGRLIFRYSWLTLLVLSESAILESCLGWSRSLRRISKLLSMFRLARLKFDAFWILIRKKNRYWSMIDSAVQSSHFLMLAASFLAPQLGHESQSSPECELIM